MRTVKNMKKIILAFSFLVFTSNVLLANGTAGSSANYEPRYIVDMPTAGILPDLHFALNSQLVSQGGFLLDATFAFFKFLNVGISYGGSGIIGSEKMNMQGSPGFHIKARILDETETAPAIVLGVNTQGKGIYFYEKKRFEQLSAGVYAAASKSYKWQLGLIALHGGINYSFEDSENSGINIYAGAEHTIYKYITAVFEINPNINDKHSGVWKKGNSWMLNGAIKFGASDNMTIEIQFKDFLRNSNYSTEVGRYFGIEFITRLL